jgi:transmembrane sensor
MDTPPYIDELAEKWIQGTITAQEKLTFDRWYNGFDFSILEVEPPEGFQETAFREKIRRRIKSQIPEFSNPEKPSRRLWPRLVAAAAVAVAVFGAGLFYFAPHTGSLQPAVVANDVAPGSSGATLTLANGQKILINEALSGNLASQAGVRISKSKNGQIVYEVSGSTTGELQYNTLSTAQGQQSELRLPDGSVVFLNAASSLSYPTRFTGQAKRQVSLTGEGYFEIAKDKAHPFVVATASQQVEVLGTHFNINSYTDEQAVATTLLEGSVKVIAGSAQQILRPNEQALNAGQRISVQGVDVEEIIDWKQGDFYLSGVSLRTAMRKIARWYNIQVVYDASVSLELESTGYISRKNKLSAVLNLIEKSGDVQFKIKGNTVYVSK